MLAALATIGIVGTYYVVRKAGSPDPRIEQEIELCRKLGILTSRSETQPSMPPDDQNAAMVYAGWKALIKEQGIPASADYNLPKLLDFHQANSAVVSEIEMINANGDVLALIHHAAKMPNRVFKKDWSLGVNLTYPELTDVRQMIRWLQGESGVLARRGKPIEAVNALSTGYLLEKQVLQTHTTLNYLTAYSIDHTVTNGLLHVAQQFRNSPELLDAISSAISTEPPALTAGDYMATKMLDLVETADMMRLPEKEQRKMLGVPAGSTGTMSVIGVIQDLAGPSPTTSGQDLKVSEAVKAGANMGQWKLKRIPITLPVILAQPPRYNVGLYDQWVNDNEVLAIHTIRPILGVRDQPLDTMIDATYDACGALVPKLRQSVDTGELRPSSTSLACLYVNLIFEELSRQRVTTENAYRSVTNAAVAVFLHRAKHSQYPESLVQTGTKSLVDPFSGRPLRYRRSALGFAVYSVGQSGKYNGGTIPAQTSEAVYRFPSSKDTR